MLCSLFLSIGLGEEENDKVILDLSRKQLKKVPKQEDAQNVRTLLLEENELQKIDNIDSYLKIEKVNNVPQMHYGCQREKHKNKNSDIVETNRIFLFFWFFFSCL